MKKRWGRIRARPMGARRAGRAPHARHAPHGRQSAAARAPRDTTLSSSECDLLAMAMWRVVVPRGEQPPPEHWGYAPPHWAPPPPAPHPQPHPQTQTQAQPQPPSRHHQSSKRAHSDSEDGDDVFSESSKDQCASPGDPDSCQMMSRKKRRGVIEKRRRDRINTSLCELRRLVPSAFEKQGSAKLEKAEILQLTVDHLKMLHAKGLDALAYDPSKFAMDYHSIGFKECAAEVARYLVTVEGLDIQDPLRLRLMSHLHGYVAQRELAAKPGWPLQPSYLDSGLGLSGSGSSANSSFESPDAAPPASSAPASSAASSAPTLTPLTTVAAPAPYHQPYHQPHYPHPHPHPQPHPQTQPHQPHYQGAFAPHQDAASQMKPYRPWGAEVAY